MPRFIPQPTYSLWDDLKIGSAGLVDALSQIGNPSLRIGITGLSRAGKTVFITGMVHALIARARLPAFAAMADGRIAKVQIAPQPDDAVPRFAYEDHLATLTAPERAWPLSTRQIAQLRLEIAYQSRRSSLGGLIGPAGLIGGGLSTLTLDLVDYPGEWLLDLPLLAKTYRDWASETLAKAGQGQRQAPFAAYLAQLAGLDPAADADEMAVRALSDNFTTALRACREEGRGLSALPPGRFLMPGDLDGAPALTFAPLRLEARDYPGASLAAMMERRFEAYKAKVVRPFFIEHFARLDRQIVLVDVLSAINGGMEALEDLERALIDVLQAFKIGTNSLLSSLFAPRITRVLFAATKADHLHHTNHARLEAVLRVLVRRALHRAQGAGAQIEVVALAAIRATRETMARDRGEELACIAGIPLSGERLGELTFDGRQETVLFPGDLPEDAETLFRGDAPSLRFLRFRPPLAQGKASTLPHIRLDVALEFLLGDVMK